MPRPLTRLEAAEPLPMRPAIRIRDLRKVFGQLIAIDGVSLDIAPGEFFMIVGPSGCGKTTLLRILAGLDSVTSGAIEIETPHSQRPVNSMIFQGDSIFPWMTVWDNAAYGLKMRRVPSSTVKEVVGHYLARTGLTRFAKYYPHQLSGGMRQRVSIARAFANDPEILLMDEPFSAPFVPVPLARPRNIMELQKMPQYGELIAHIWSSLREEVHRARQQEEEIKS